MINRIETKKNMTAGTCDLRIFKLEIKITSTGQFGAVSDVFPVCQQWCPLVLIVRTAPDEVERLSKFPQSQLCLVFIFHVRTRLQNHRVEFRVTRLSRPTRWNDSGLGLGLGIGLRLGSGSGLHFIELMYQLMPTADQPVNFVTKKSASRKISLLDLKLDSTKFKTLLELGPWAPAGRGKGGGLENRRRGKYA